MLSLFQFPWLKMQMVDAWGGWSLFQELLHTLKKVASKHGTSIATVAVRYILDQVSLNHINPELSKLIYHTRKTSQWCSGCFKADSFILQSVKWLCFGNEKKVLILYSHLQILPARAEICLLLHDLDMDFSWSQSHPCLSKIIHCNVCSGICSHRLQVPWLEWDWVSRSTSRTHRRFSS